MRRHIYTLRRPASWHKELWREALPLGNGYTGILIPGSVGKERVTFNRFDLWEGGGDREVPDVTAAHFAMRGALDRRDYAAANRENLATALRENGYGTPIDCPHNLGWLDMEFEPAALFRGYRRGVNMQTGEAFVAFTVNGCRFRRDAFVSRAHDMTVMRMTADEEFTAAYDFRLYNPVVVSETHERSLYRASADGYTSVRVEFIGTCTTTVCGSAFMYEAALFYLDYAVEDGDSIRLYPSVSPENTPDGFPNVVAENATMDFAILKELLTNLLCGMEITGLYADEADAFRGLLRKIPPYMLNEDGAVKEWMHPAIKDQYYHRHLSHIYPVFPGSEITAHNNPALFEAFKQAVRLRKLGAQSGWSMAHMASIYARMGEGDLSLGCIDAMAKNVIHDSLLTTHNDWRNMGTSIYWDGEAFVQLDAAFGVVNALQEMLFCAQKEALSILPALPERLTAGCVRGLVFPEGTVDIAWQTNGDVTVTIRAERPLTTSILLCGQEVCQLTLNEGESRTVSGKLDGKKGGMIHGNPF